MHPPPARPARPAPLRLLLDATPLGSGADPGASRAGIFRVSQGFVQAALARPDLEIALASPGTYISDLELSRYVRADGARLTGRQVHTWRHPGVPREESLLLLDRMFERGETRSPEGRRMLGTLMLTNRLATPLALEGRYDIYHSLRPALAPPGRVNARARVLLIHDVIPFLFPDLVDQGFAQRLEEILQSVDPARDWIICNSECTRRDLLARLAIDPGRVSVVPLAADPAVFHPVTDRNRISRVRDRYGLGDRPYLLSVSTIEPRKNLAHLIRGFAALVPRLAPDDGLQLALVGATGWKTGGIFDELARTGAVRDRIVVTGYVPDEDLAPLYAGADAFVYPSRYEGFGLPVLEAMQCGAPVVTTTGGALPEVVGAAGLTVDPDDGDGLITAIGIARRNPGVVAAGLARAASFTWERTVDLTVTAWRVMLA